MSPSGERNGQEVTAKPANPSPQIQTSPYQTLVHFNVKFKNSKLGGISPPTAEATNKILTTTNWRNSNNNNPTTTTTTRTTTATKQQFMSL